MPYVDFITDEYFEYCIKELHDTYMRCKRETDLKSFYKNKIDPIKGYFDMKFNDITIDDYIKLEMTRQKDKTISNAIGTFHEKLLGGLKDLEWMPVGHGYDIKKTDNSLFAELKNKHNTVKGEDKKAIHNKLAEVADAHPSATCYYVQIIAKNSINEVWKFTSKDKEYTHPRVRIISADKFYELVTGDPDAFLKICSSLHKVADNVLNKNSNEVSNSNSTVYNELITKSSENNFSILEQLFKDTFNDYNGFANLTRLN